ncbi:FAD dependent oxidoreductase [Phycomyces blakesleeanus]|uniref:L-2-hydroxyglutarate dehydrogenase, mitochondrial n=2 Tax=Phycomyces blakesleeanus TaxID=4837 RepID=A0A162TGW3_PHYB8|nr:hypothetical protein PHYBLDRAFT_156390 [Phycomyces blakesleeanus NRRL 1555(-)]OAD68492.1 hypothetical protein PHYBLDRAFT_156390 [Phycomyces blakesleeanus NRRL 1555(-)]|eukprot:XP_018286532.1 hypothetical protein PHYBLDRAFT_156390 [Phycomyces blakesleeanus NRRL 1555(-)]
MSRWSLWSSRAITHSRRFYSAKAPDIEVDNLVVGGGVIGLAIAEKLTRARSAETTVLVEKNGAIGEETSSRNSEVIHAGLYYPIDSLKTRLCIQGNRMLYDIAARKSIPHKRIGKWIVAQTPEQHEYLTKMHQKANSLGVETHFLDKQQANKLEPEIQCHSVLVSPSTGIVDSHALMEYLAETAQQQGGDLALSTRVRKIETSEGQYRVTITSPLENEPDTVVLAKRVFNSAGLHADKISNMLMPDRYKLYYAKGHYFSYNAPNNIQHLIYPCPEKNLAGLGTHLTLDMAGQIKFGPDVEYVDRLEYNVPDNQDKIKSFGDAIHRYWPPLDPQKLQPSYAGIRPKLARPGESFRDFEIREERDSGYANFYTLIGIESPGLTCCLAIADHVHELIRD